MDGNAQPAPPTQFGSNFCSNCGKPLSPGSRFCASCGHEAGTAVAAPSAASSGTPQAGILPAPSATGEEALKRIAAAALELIRPVIAAKPHTSIYEIYLEHAANYTDSFLRVNHMAGLFKRPDASTPVKNIEIEITLRPGILRPEFVTYNLGIANPATAPKNSGLTEWTYDTQHDYLPLDLLLTLEPYYLDMLQNGRLTADYGNSMPPQEAPENYWQKNQ